MSAAEAAATGAVIEGIVVWRRDGGGGDDDAAWSLVAGGPPRRDVSVGVEGREGDDSDFYHREMNSDCSPAFRALDDGMEGANTNTMAFSALPRPHSSTRMD